MQQMMARVAIITLKNQKEGAQIMGFMKEFEKVFTAAAFAEAGEHETARQILREREEDVKRQDARPDNRIQAPGIKR